MREEWKSARLGEVSKMIKRGIAPKYAEAGGVCVINQKCIRGHSINYDLSRRHDVDVKKVPTERFIRLGDVLVNSTGTGTLGRVAQVRSEPTEPATVDTHVTIVRPIDGVFYHDFFGYMLIKIEDEIINSGEGASGQTELARSKLENQFFVSFPQSIVEQKRIVAILDEAFAGIDTVVANTEKNLVNAREIFESYRDGVFSSQVEGWRTVELGDLCAIKHGFAFKSEFFTTEGDYIVLTPGSFWEHGGFRDQGKKTKYYEGEIPDGYLLVKGDFLFAMTEQAAGLLGSSLVVPESDRYLHNQRLGLVQPKDGVEWHNDFFFHQFNTPKFRSAVQSTASGAKVRHTSPKKLCAIPVVYPLSRDEQDRVASKLNRLWEETRRLEAIYQHKLTALAELKQSLLHKAFSGELTAERAEGALEVATA